MSSIDTIIGLLSYGIYLVIDDLDHPFRPGNWHLKADEYEALFDEVKEENEAANNTVF